MTNHEDRYTDRLRQALVFASQEALRLKHAKVGPEHLVLGILKERTGLGLAVLSNLGVDSHELAEAIEREFMPGTRAVQGTPELSAEAKKSLAGAVDEANRLRTSWVGQEHLLLSLLSGGGALSKVFQGFHVTHGLADSQVAALLRLGQSKVQMKRYNLALPEDMFREVEQLASAEGVTVLEVLRRSVKLGLLVARAQQTPGTAFIIREGDRERQLVLL